MEPVRTLESSSAAPVTARSVLRSMTHPIHLRVEGRLQLASPGITRQRYVDTLHGMLAAYTALEDQLEAHAVALSEVGLDWPSHRKAHWIRADLAALGSVRPASSIVAAPSIQTLAEALGCLYVMEGATLGGAVIQRNARARLRLGPDEGARFFTSYGEAVGPRWKQFCLALELGLQDAASRHEAVRTAVATFTLIEASVIANET